MKCECNVHGKVLIDHINREQIENVYMCKVNVNKECSTELCFNWQVVSLRQLFLEVTLFFWLQKKPKKHKNL